MLSHRRLLAAGAFALIALEWVVVAAGRANGFVDLLTFVGPAALLSVAVAWLFFTFAGRLFTWPRAFRSVLAGTAILTPVVAYYFAASRDQTLGTKFLVMIAVGWAASLGGTLWNLGSAAGDAFREWRLARQAGHRRTVGATA